MMKKHIGQIIVNKHDLSNGEIEKITANSAKSSKKNE